MVVHSGGSNAPLATACTIKSSRWRLWLAGNFSSTAVRRARFWSRLKVDFESSINWASSGVSPASAEGAVGKDAELSLAAGLVAGVLRLLQAVVSAEAAVSTMHARILDGVRMAFRSR